MKKISISLSIALISLCGIAQDNSTKQEDNAAISLGFEDTTEFTIDTLRIASGKPYVFLLDVAKEYNDDTVQIVGGPLDEEEKELLKNFEKNSFEIIKQYKHVFILFENGQTLDLSSVNNTYKGVAYWHGAMDDDVILKQTTTKSTEFIAEQMGLDKQSSYITNTAKYKKALVLLQNSNEVTEKSKLIMNNVLGEIYKTFLSDKLGQDANLFDQAPKNLKKMNLYVTSETKAKMLFRSVEMNEKGQVDKIILFNRSGELSGSIQYRYENDILKETINNQGDITTYSYADDKMISFTNVGDANETNVYWLENGRRNFENYIIMIDEAYSVQNRFSRIVYEKNCQIHYINDDVWTRECFTDSNVFPYVHKYTSYQDGEVLQYQKFKIEKENKKTYKKYYSNAQQETDKDEYVHRGTYQLDDNKLVHKYVYMDDGKHLSLDIEYIYNN